MLAGLAARVAFLELAHSSGRSDHGLRLAGFCNLVRARWIGRRFGLGGEFPRSKPTFTNGQTQGGNYLIAFIPTMATKRIARTRSSLSSRTPRRRYFAPHPCRSSGRGKSLTIASMNKTAPLHVVCTRSVTSFCRPELQPNNWRWRRRNSPHCCCRSNPKRAIEDIDAVQSGKECGQCHGLDSHHGFDVRDPPFGRPVAQMYINMYSKWPVAA